MWHQVPAGMPATNPTSPQRRRPGWLGSKLPSAGHGGVYTPSAAFGAVLVERLRAAGMGFDDQVDLAALPGEPDAQAEA